MDIPLTRDEFVRLARDQRVVPVLRSARVADALEQVRRLVGAGCRLIELTTSIPHWQDALTAARQIRVGGEAACIGVGTVFDTTQARAALDTGAAFVVSPVLAPAVAEVVHGAGAAMVQGALTPTEVAAAASAGPVKIFPAHVFGPAYLRSLGAVFPETCFIPTGGITLEEVSAYLQAGATAVGIGSGLPDDDAALARVFAPAQSPVTAITSREPSRP